LCLLPLLAAAPATAHAQGEGSTFVPGQVVIGWTPDGSVVPAGHEAAVFDVDRSAPEWQAAARELAARAGLQVADMQPEYGTALLKVPAGEEATEIARLRNLSWVTYAELNYVARAAADAAYPDDPAFGDQWHMRRIYAPEAWAVTYGSSSLVVAVLDSGVDRNHPEFYRQFHDPLLPGWDYINGDSNPNDDYGHGTHVTGLIAAATNNGLGVAGLAQNVKILPLKVLDASGAGDFYTIAKAIRRAADFGAQVMNLSLGGLVQFDEQRMTLQSAVDYAVARNALVVAAAGNCAQGGEGCGYPNPAFYPAACDGVFAVAASDHFDNWATYSNYQFYVSLAAPGGLTDDALLSTVPGGGYGFKYGTSMATALVSGAAALVWTLQPAASYQQVAGILKDTADKVGTNPLTGQSIPYINGRNDYFGYGRLNVGQAVRRAYPPTLTPITEVQQFLLGGSLTQQSRLLTLTNPSSQQIQWRATVVRGGAWLSIAPTSGSAAYDHPGVLTLQVSSAMLGPGLYFGTVRVEPQPGVSFAGFDIEVQLRVSSTLRRTSLPVVAREWAAPEWFDPLGDPSRQALGLTNDEVRQLRLPFSVAFYGVAQTRIGISNNGMVLLGQPRTYRMDPPEGCLQTAVAPNDAIYVLALDWRPDLGGQEVYVHQPDADTYVVTWYQMRRAGNSTAQTFQLVLRRNGPITANYQAVEAVSPGIIGVENWDGTVAQQIRCGGTGRAIRSGETVSFSPVLPW
jgi:thermitase